MDQKMIKILGGIIAGFAVFIILIFVISSCTNKTYTYESLEEKMMQIAKSHYETNPDDLPKEDKDSKVLTLKKMITSGYLDEVTELFDNENVKCDGKVTVTNNNGYYLYTPELSCSGLADGEDYKSRLLADVIIEDNLVEDGVGLYEVAGRGYIFKGETLNNYVQMDGKDFRIIGINEDGTIRLFELKGLERIKWDDRYNEEERYASGFNEYYYNSLDSRIKATLEEYYDNSEVWTDEMKAYITTQNVCIGKRLADDATKDGVVECSSVVENQIFSLLRTDEYLNASLDTDCASTTDKSCRNYNWFTTIGKSFWTTTADASTTHKVYKLTDQLNSSIASSPSGANVVINITDLAVYAGGTGTQEDPYLFR